MDFKRNCLIGYSGSGYGHVGWFIADKATKIPLSRLVDACRRLLKSVDEPAESMVQEKQERLDRLIHRYGEAKGRKIAN